MNIENYPEKTIISFPFPMTCISSAPFGGGIRKDVRTIANLTIPRNLKIPADGMPSYCEEVLGYLDCVVDKSIALLTAVPQIYFGQSKSGKCFATVGLGNACKIIPDNVWDEASEKMILYSPGTINCVVELNCNLSSSALVDAHGIAKIAIAEFVRGWSAFMNLPAYVGTPTDCVVLACLQSGPEMKFAGLGTKIGADIVTMVNEAMTEAVLHKYPDFEITDL